MPRKNLFDGDSYKAQFANIIYRQLMKRRWVTFDGIMAEYCENPSPEGHPYVLSKCEGYGELKKAFGEVKKAIIEKVGADCLKEDGNNRNKRFKYTGKDKDPLEDMRNAKVVNDLRVYSRFCQDSAGFFPTSWLEYFFKDCQDLLDIKARRKKGEQIISSSLDRIVKNIEFLPIIYEAIVKRQVLEIDYKAFGKEQEKLIFHPQYLKEFNGRWHLLGHVEGRTPEIGFDVALDRIQSKPKEYKPREHTEEKKDYIAAPSMFYENFYKDIVGVSHEVGASIEHIIIRAHTRRIFGLAETKPIHPSQEIVTQFGEHNDGTYGEFSIDVEVNDELIGKILQMRDGFEIMSPENVRERFCKFVKQLAELYGLNGSKSKRNQ